MKEHQVKTILIVDDDRKSAALLEESLRQSGFDSIRESDGSRVVSLVRERTPDLILLDLMLPGNGGLEICRQLRSFSEVPIIMVSALDAVEDRLRGLEIGADDYICLPFSLREIVARVKMVLRRVERHPPPRAHQIDFDEERFHAELHGKNLELTVIEYRLLRLLSQNPGRIFSRLQLMLHVYQDQRVVCNRTIDSHIKKLRKKMIEAAPEVELIHSLYGIGYKFESH
jgi:two-component system, OmpR family, response regulator BaeR